VSAPPTISVLLPAFDAGGTLHACLRSVARQTEPDFECVIVDDGSRDDTAALASGFADADPRFRIVALDHRGLVGALSAGLEHCRGRYVARMDADDLMHRERLAAQRRRLDAEPGLAAVGSHVRLFPRTGLGPGNLEYEAWLNGIGSASAVSREAFVECPVAHPTLTIRRDVLERHGYRDRGWPEDYDLLLRLLGAGESIGVVPRRLLSWRHGSDRLSRTADAYRIERFTACKAEFLATSFLKEAERYALWGYGSTGRTLAAALAEHGKRPGYVVELHPGRLGNRIAGADVVDPEALAEREKLPLVVSVAGAVPRARIREFLDRRGYVELVDYVCAA
jgi:glycosyltransferase involved in cell wall biosynthesis